MYYDKYTISDLLYMVEQEGSVENYLQHHGVSIKDGAPGRGSGRYPLGSGENPNQHDSGDFLSRVEELRKKGFSYKDEDGKTYTGDAAIYKSMGISSTEFRKELSAAKYERRVGYVLQAEKLSKEGKGPTEIGRIMGVSESTVRSFLNPSSKAKMMVAQNTADFLEDQIKKKEMIDVGKGVEKELGISREKLDEALYLLERKGYGVYSGGITQATNPTQQTTQKVLCAPGIEHKEIYDLDRVKSVTEYTSHDDGKTYSKFIYPESMDSKRLKIRYAEDGGLQKDGLIEIRRGVKDLSLGNDRIAQVRILVDGTHYLKGMAVYSDGKDMPDGVDVIFNTNKHKDKSKLEVLKEAKEGDNPFGSTIKSAAEGGQSFWYDDNGKSHLSLINKRAREGEWGDWSDSLPSQFLSKQPLALAEKQLNLAKASKQDEYADIMALTNPTIKKYLLNKFSDECDSAAVHLKAAALPGQKYHVIIPIPSMKDNEIYAPRYENGTKLALVRYPHGGIFEIPILTVNNTQKDAKKVLGASIMDAVGINSNVAEQLSGADFDGDTVMCIPTHNGKVKISNRKPFDELKNFDPKMEYPEVPGMTYMKDTKRGVDNTQKQMGEISNLITDMTLANAEDEDLIKAVRHSMVVIDAGKHKLDYKKSEVDNDIARLKRKYQNGKGGAGTLISRAKGQYSEPRTVGSPTINTKLKANGQPNPYYDPTRPEGALIYKKDPNRWYPERSYKDGMTIIKTLDGKNVSYDSRDKAQYDKYNPTPHRNEDGTVSYTNPDGTIQYKVKERKQRTTKMAATDDAYTLLSNHKHPMEVVYADYANSMKALANEARKSIVATGNLKYSKEAKAKYADEVKSLELKLNGALLNAPREREAQRRANVEIQAKKAADPKMANKDLKKISQQAISKARVDVGSVKRRDRNIEITDKEWEAIQAGAITESTLQKILNNTDIDRLRELATPKQTTKLTPAKINRIKLLASSGNTIAEIAKSLGISTSTVSEYMK